jgi:esterase/lipase superfamily enzyme
MEPSLNFYRITRTYSWLVPVTRKPISDPDYIYTFERELGPADSGVVLASYPDLHTVLLRTSHADGR